MKTSPEGRVSGFVVATAFSGKDPMERQHLVRDLLRSRLPEGTMRSVGLLMTVTPSELAAALEDD
ncbi:MAG: hypothetical protein HYU66_27365 [Armatimonadetes bacterium]|nr:hypothetical protein [Armatimonadota bacterium]